MHLIAVLYHVCTTAGGGGGGGGKLLQHLRLERGGEHMVLASCTKTTISLQIYKISRHMIHQKIAYFQPFGMM